jgi:hypothetical protein
MLPQTAAWHCVWISCQYALRPEQGTEVLAREKHHRAVLGFIFLTGAAAAIL